MPIKLILIISSHARTEKYIVIVMGTETDCRPGHFEMHKELWLGYGSWDGGLQWCK